MSSWSDVKASWSSGWKALQDSALRKWGDAIRRRPEEFRPQVQATVDDLAAARAHLDHMKPLLPKRIETAEDQRAVSTFSAMSRRYYELAAGIYADAQPASTQVGVAPVLVVAGVVLGVAAIAWAVAAHQYAKNLREQTALADRELTARVEASRQGRTLQPSTLPKPEDKNGAGLGWALVGALVLAAGAAAAPVLMKKRSA